MPLPHQEHLAVEPQVARTVKRTRLAGRAVRTAKRTRLAGQAVLALAASVLAQGCLRAPSPDSPASPRPRGYVHAPPFVWWTRESGGHREVRNFLGFLYHQSRTEGGRRRTTHFMWPLGMSSVERLPDGRTRRAVRALPFVWITRRSEPSGAGHDYYQLRVNVLGPVFSLSTDNYGEGYMSAHFLWPLGHYFRGEKRVGFELRKFRSFRFLPIFQYERNWRPGRVRRGKGRLPGETPPPGETAEIRLDERGTFRFLHFLLGLEREADEGICRLYLLGATARDRETGRRTTIALWGSERGPSTDREHQLLWRFVVLRRSGAPTLRGGGGVDGSPRRHGEIENDRPMALAPQRDSAPFLPAGKASRRSLSLGASVADVSSEKPSERWRLVQWMFHGSPRVHAHVGPVVSYDSDWEADTRRVSVLFGLYSYERRGLEKSWRILWVFGRRRR